MRALVQQLEKSVLAVNAGFAPNNRAGFGGHGRAVALHLFAVGFHVKLLDEFGQAVQVLVVWRDDVAAAAVKIDIPNAEHPQNHGQVALQGRADEMPVHLVRAFQHFNEVFFAQIQHNRQADGRP